MDAQFAFYQRTNNNSQKTAKIDNDQDPAKAISIRKLLNEQPNNGKLMKKSTSLIDDEYDLSTSRFTPLPDIPRADDVYFRTESRLMKETTSNKPENTTSFEAYVKLISLTFCLLNDS